MLSPFMYDRGDDCTKWVQVEVVCLTQLTSLRGKWCLLQESQRTYTLYLRKLSHIHIQYCEVQVVIIGTRVKG